MATKHGKKYREAIAKLPADREPLEDPAEALQLVKDLAYASFDETVEVSLRLGVDPRHADQIVRGTVVLPHGTGREVRILVLAQRDKAAEAGEAGADYVGMEYIDKINEDCQEIDDVGATPDVMGQVGRRYRINGPRGLMPSTRAGTVICDVGDAVREIKAGKIEYRVDRTRNLHAPIGRVSFTNESLEPNYKAF